MRNLSSVTDNKDVATKEYVDGRTLNDIPSIMSKEYSGLYGSSNDADGASFYFASVRPTTFYDVWSVRYKVYAKVPNQNNYRQYSEVELVGNQNAVTYASFNRIYSTDYVSYLYHNVYRLNSTGYNAGYKHWLGVGLRGSTNPTSSSYPRTIKIEIIETNNCEVEMLNTPIKVASISGYGTTNFTGLLEINGRDNGLQETGDANTIHQLRHNNGNYTAATALYRYQICFSKNETSLLPANAVNNSTATNKTLTTAEFNPFGQILYYNSTTAVSANGAIAASALVQQINMDLRYSFNTGTTLTSGKDVYVVATPQSNGMAKLASTPISQTLPTTADGKIYIYLGHASSTSAVELHPEHPVYEYKDSSLRLYTNAVTSSGTATTVKINGTSITSNNIADLQVVGTYDSSTNKLMTKAAVAPDVLYNNSTGTTGNISLGLASIVGVYDYLEIFYYASDMYGSVKMDVTKRKATITVSHDYSNLNIYQLKTLDLTLASNGRSISRGTESYCNLICDGSNVISRGTETSVYIFKVLGWKY